MKSEFSHVLLLGHNIDTKLTFFLIIKLFFNEYSIFQTRIVFIHRILSIKKGVMLSGRGE